MSDVKLEPGDWLTADRRIAVVVARNPVGRNGDWPWEGFILENEHDSRNGRLEGERCWGDDGSPFADEDDRIVERVSTPDQARISALEAENAELKAALNSERAITTHLQAAIATYRDKALWKLIIAAYSKVPINSDKRAIVADAREMRDAVEEVTA